MEQGLEGMPFGDPAANALPIGVLLLIYGIGFLIALAIQLAICYVLYRAADSIPESYRQASPGQAFLLLIPLFNIFWLFVYPKKLSQSFQALFASSGQAIDDCGEKMGLYWAVCAIASIVPCVGIVFGIAGLVTMIIYLIKVSECRQRALAMNVKGFNTPQF